MNHCVAKIVELVERGHDDRRSVLQLGYNLGRLSELTAIGREPFWDRWKGPVAAWDLPTLRQLAHELQFMGLPAHHPDGGPPGDVAASRGEG